MKSLVEGIRTLAGLLNSVRRISNSDELHRTINEFTNIMREVMDFIQEWLKCWTRTYEFM